jgi:hypothetical protein
MSPPPKEGSNKSRVKNQDVERALITWARNEKLQEVVITDDKLKEQACFFFSTFGNNTTQFDFPIENVRRVLQVDRPYASSSEDKFTLGRREESSKLKEHIFPAAPGPLASFADSIISSIEDS